MRDHPAETIRRDLRFGRDPFLRRRRGIVGLSLFSASCLGVIALFQTGIFKRLPDPPISSFDADKVNGSAEAYSLLRTPDGLLGLVSYSTTAFLAGMGSGARWQNESWMPVMMGAKAAADAAMAAKLGLKQATKFGKFSAWSLLVSAGTFASLWLAWPEVKQALLAGQRDRKS